MSQGRLKRQGFSDRRHGTCAQAIVGEVECGNDRVGRDECGDNNGGSGAEPRVRQIAFCARIRLSS